MPDRKIISRAKLNYHWCYLYCYLPSVLYLFNLFKNLNNTFNAFEVKVNYFKNINIDHMLSIK